MVLTSVAHRTWVRALLALSVAMALLSWTDLAPAWASASRLCNGYAQCNTGGYTSHDYQDHSGQSYWRADAGNECTNYAAFVESTVFGAPTPGYLLGNGGDWARTAVAHSVPVDQTPSVGAVAEWNAGDYGMGGDGHVAVVEQVGPGYVVVSQQNISTDTNSYDWEKIYAGTTNQWEPWPDNFIHFIGGSGTPGLTDGSFVTHAGFVYRIAGGAPIYVSSWNAVGGAQPTTPLSDAQFSALPQFPHDGTFLDASDGSVYVVAGGAPLYVSNWAAVGGPHPGVAIDAAAVGSAGAGVPWDHLRSTPTDGTFLDGSDGSVYVVAGGAPLYVSDWAAVGGPHPGVAIDAWDINNITSPAAHLRSTPLDGTFLTTSTGANFIVAGGAALPISDWAPYGGAQTTTNVDQWDIDHTASAAAHLRTLPADGTLLYAKPTGSFWLVSGGCTRSSSAGSAAVTVNDAALRTLAACSSAVGGNQPVPPVSVTPPPVTASPAPPKPTPTPARQPLAARAKTLTVKLQLGSLPRGRQFRISGRGATVASATFLGHGKWKLQVRIAKGTALTWRDLTVVLHKHTYRTIRRALLL